MQDSRNLLTILTRIVYNRYMKKIPLTKGKFALVDDEDFEYLSRSKWHYTNGYARCKSIFMHRQIMNTPANMVTDHINSDKLDNRKSNLRICTRQQNNIHVGVNRYNTSGYKGVSKKDGRWYVQLKFNKKFVLCKYYYTKEEAALAYNEAAYKYFGEFAYINTIKK